PTSSGIRVQPPQRRHGGGSGGRAVLAARVLLGRLRLELETDEALVPDDPRIVTGLDHVGVTWSELDLGAIFVADGQPARLHDAHVSSLAAVRARNGLDALRPAPSRLETEASGRCASHANDLDAGLFGRAGLVGRVESAFLD